MIEMVPVDDLPAHPDNPKTHDVELVVASMRRFGFADPVVVDTRTGLLIAGHGRVEALKRLRDADEAPPSGVGEGWEVPTFTGWASADDVEARAALVALNRSTEQGGWDNTALVAVLEQLASADAMAGVGFDTSALDELRRLVAPPPDLTDPELAAPAEPVSRLGDVWSIGPHRVVCGDSSDADVLDRLLDGVQVGALLTDPPYGINLDTDYNKPHGKVSGRTYRPVAGDDRPFDAGFLSTYFGHVAEQWWWGANYYRRTLPAPDLSGSWLVWDKRTEATDVVAGSGFELAWSRQKHKQDVLRHLWTNYTSQHNDGHRREHPTEKPVGVLIEILTRWAPDGCVVVDPFAGSGTTLLAAARTGRVGFGIDLDPAYVDVAVSRLVTETGLDATRQDGATFTSLSDG